MSGIDVHLIGITVCFVCVFYTVLVSLRWKIVAGRCNQSTSKRMGNYYFEALLLRCRTTTHSPSRHAVCDGALAFSLPPPHNQVYICHYGHCPLETQTLVLLAQRDVQFVVVFDCPWARSTFPRVSFKRSTRSPRDQGAMYTQISLLFPIIILCATTNIIFSLNYQRLLQK